MARGKRAGFERDYGMPAGEVARRLVARLLESGEVGEVRIEVPGASVLLRPLPERNLGSLSISRTLVKVEGDPDAVNLIEEALKLGGG